MRLGSLALTLDLRAFEAVWLLHQAAGAARRHLEDRVLSEHQLNWTSFLVLWELWIWGEEETRYVAEEAGISKGTLTGVVAQLMDRGLVSRRVAADDRRLVLLKLTRRGSALMHKLFPRFNSEESFLTEPLAEPGRRELADRLRQILAHLEEAAPPTPRDGQRSPAPRGATATARAARKQPADRDVPLRLPSAGLDG